MIYTVARVIAFAFNELYKFIRRRTQKREGCGVAEFKHVAAEVCQELSKEKPKNITHECAACSKGFTQGVEEDETVAPVEKKDAKGEYTIAENVGTEECSNVFASSLVAQASSPKSQKTTSSRKKSSNTTRKCNSRITSIKIKGSRKKGRRFRTFVPEPSAHDILKKKLLEKRRQIFKMYTFKL